MGTTEIGPTNLQSAAKATHNMAKKKPKVWSDKSIAALSSPQRVRIDRCLYLRISADGAKRWVFRWRDGDRLRDLGMGVYGKQPDQVSLAQARELAATYRGMVKAGIDPIAAKAKGADSLAFGECALAYIAAQEKGWKNPKHKVQWRNTLERYCAEIWDVPVSQIGQEHVVKVLDPIWHSKTETASRVRGRMEKILDWASVRKYREGENPARWKGRLEALYPAAAKLKNVQHHKSLPYAQMFDFLQELKAEPSLAARGIELAILTACRTNEVTAAKWEEFDLEQGLWIIPASRMKSGKPHRVPLSPQAIELLYNLDKTNEFVFGKKGLPPHSMLFRLREMNKDFTVHGFRSTFRVWCAERTNVPREVAEAALAHTNKDKVEASYLHTDHLEKRSVLMNQWASFCFTKPSKANVSVLQIA